MGINLTEPAIVPDNYASGFTVEDLGDGNYRLTFFSTQRSLYDGMSLDHVVGYKAVLPAGAALIGVKNIMVAAGVQCCGGERLRKLSH